VPQLEGVVGEYQALIARLVAEKESMSPPGSQFIPLPLLYSLCMYFTIVIGAQTHATTQNGLALTSKELTTEMSQVDINDDAGISNGYFNSYAHFGIHMSMLKVIHSDIM
jgi:hypothetical protein